MSELQHQIIETLGSKPEIDPREEIERRVSFLVDYARSAGARGFVLGISGGQDSSLAGRLAQLAVERLQADESDKSKSYGFVAVRLPYGVQKDEEDAQLALSFIQPVSTVVVDVAPGVDAIASSVSEGLGFDVADFHRGNIKARMRMVAQYAIAGELKLLVIGTDHAAEAITGFFTKFGDGAADVLPLSGLTKSQGASMLKELDAPARLYEKAPTADLLDGIPAQPDEDSLGVSYAQIDGFLRGEEIDPYSTEILERRYQSTEHKRQPPVAPTDSWWKV
jgi:NAD+ synthase